MKDTVRVSFDVTRDDHTLLKAFCVNSHISFKNFMQESFHQTAESVKKNEFHQRLLKGFKQAYNGETIEITDDYLKKMKKSIAG